MNKKCELCGNDIQTNEFKFQSKLELSGTNINFHICGDCTKIISNYVKEGVKVCRDKNKEAKEIIRNLNKVNKVDKKTSLF